MLFKVHIDKDAPEIAHDLHELKSCIQSLARISRKIGKYDTDLTELNKPADKSVSFNFAIDIDTNKLDTLTSEISDLGDQLAAKVAEYQKELCAQLKN